MNRLKCAGSCVWLGLWALWDGAERAGSLGWRIAPRFGFFLDMLSLWFLPFLFAAVLGSMGGTLGYLAFIGSMVEAFAQLFLAEPYNRPLSRVLVDWIPET